MNTYFLEFHNWNLHLTYLSFADMFIFCLFWKGGRVDLLWLAGIECYFFSLFLSIANKVKIEKLYCVKKKMGKKKEYNKVSAYACFIKIKQRK